MNSQNLSENAESYLISFFEILTDFERNVRIRGYTNSIAYDAANDILLCKKAMAKLSREMLGLTTYIPLAKIANELVDDCESFEPVCRKIKCSCKNSSDSTVFVFQNRNDNLFKKTFYKAEKMKEYNSVDKNYIKHIQLFSILEINICKNLLRFETDKLAEETADAMLDQETQRMTKLRYLFNCV